MNAKNENLFVALPHSSTMSKTNVYVLKLERGRYYIGKSDDVMKRYEEHLNGRGSAWTNQYAPVSLIETRKNVSSFEEDKVTKEYMSKYGIDNVRGGAYVSLELDTSQRSALAAEIRSATDKCTNCGRSGHFVKDCHMKSNKVVSRKSVTCYRCGTPGHYANTCNVNRGYVTYEEDTDDEDDDSDDEDDGSEEYDSDY